jgi:hypothetical protein
VITVVGGCYHEICISPPIRQFYGSGGRAAAALATTGESVTLHAYVSAGAESQVRRLEALSGFKVNRNPSADEISFAYVSPLHSPLVDPGALAIHASEKPIVASGDLILMFGMIEGGAQVKGGTVVYDPQNGDRPRFFHDTGSSADRLAVICNLREAKGLVPAGNRHPGYEILKRERADVVVVKQGPAGAAVFTSEGEEHIPAFLSDSVFSIGSGDIFAAAFAFAWGRLGMPPAASAKWASQSVAWYVSTRQERFPSDEDRALMKPAHWVPGRVYLAGPFFTMAQRWLVEQTRAVFLNINLEVFSPLHDVGHGTADEIAEADLDGLAQCDRVFAITDGLDAGTIFEIGYARKMGLPVYAYSELVGSEDCKMIAGSGCKVIEDYATAIYATAWRL